MPDIPTLLKIRAALASILLAFTLLSALALFIYRKGNGLTAAMGWERLAIAGFIAVVVFTSFVDVAQMVPQLRQQTLAVWNIISFLWVLASVWLLWKALRDG